MTLNRVSPLSNAVSFGSRPLVQSKAPIQFGAQNHQNDSASQARLYSPFQKFFSWFSPASPDPVQKLAKAFQIPEFVIVAEAFEAPHMKTALTITPSGMDERKKIGTLFLEMFKHKANSPGRGLLLQGQNLNTGANEKIIAALCNLWERPLFVANSSVTKPISTLEESVFWDALGIPFFRKSEKTASEQDLEGINIQALLKAADQVAQEQGASVVYLGNLKDYADQPEIHFTLIEWLDNPEKHPGVMLIFDLPYEQGAEVDSSLTSNDQLTVLDFSN